MSEELRYFWEKEGHWNLKMNNDNVAFTLY